MIVRQTMSAPYATFRDSNTTRSSSAYAARQAEAAAKSKAKRCVNTPASGASRRRRTRTLTQTILWYAFLSMPLIAFAANFTEPRMTVARTADFPSVPAKPKLVIFRSRAQSRNSVSQVRRLSTPFTSAGLTPREIKAFVKTQAGLYGVDPALALWIVKHESHFNPHAKGDGDASRGLWQISKIYHPEVSDSAAFNVAASTDWSLDRILAGKANEWSTYRFCREWYSDCPF